MVDGPSSPELEITVELDDENQRPTVNPPFDIAAYARATASSTPSELATTRPPPSNDPSGRPQKAPRSPSPLFLADGLVPTAPPPHDVLQVEQVRDLTTPSPWPEAPSNAPNAPSDAPEIREQTPFDPAAEMRDRASLGDYTGALEMAELLLAADPTNVEALECIDTCRAILEKMYSARLGALDRAPIVIVPRAQMRWLSIDHRAGFILSLIDGSSTLDVIIDVSGMQKLDALRILLELVQQRIVAFRT